MNNVLEDSLFVSQTKKFDEIQSIVRQFSAEYVGNSVIKDNIFAVIQNYARKKEIALEMLRYPIHDDELWALTFLKQDTIFVCVNTALPLCKQFFAAAHELYHIYCYVENADQSYIKNGSMLDSATGDETGRTQEDLEANAFAGLLLMPDQLLHEQILLYANFSGTEYLFGGTSIKREAGKELSIDCTLEITEGTAKVFWISGSDEAVTLIETTGTYSDTITLPDGGNYIGIECENFTGNIELNIE